MQVTALRSKEGHLASHIPCSMLYPSPLISSLYLAEYSLSVSSSFPQHFELCTAKKCVSDCST